MWILTCRTVLLRLVVTQWDRLVMSGAPQVMREAHFSLKGRRFHRVNLYESTLYEVL